MAQGGHRRRGPVGGFVLGRPLVAGIAVVVVLVAAVATGYALRPHPARTAAEAATVRTGGPADPATNPAPTTAPPAAARPAGSLSTAPTTRSATPTAATHPTRTSPTPTGQAQNPPAAQTAKKGVSAWKFDGVTAAMRDVGASWFYTWSSNAGGIAAPAGVRFVPMIWGPASVTDEALAEAKNAGGPILGFNEPDLAGQANMPVQQALDLWPKLQATGRRLGSPAPAFGAATPGSWFDQFMSGAASRGYRVDFIALHWYGSDFSAAATGQLRGYLQAVYDRYHKPIWLTEYALINFGGSPKFPDGAQLSAFVTASTAMLRSLPYVERYAWFSLGVGDNGPDTGLYQPGAVATVAGRAYRAAG
jgi:hypothetical protein